MAITTAIAGMGPIGVLRLICNAKGYMRRDIGLEYRLARVAFTGEFDMRYQWIAVELYRLQVVEGWPNSRYKEATLAAIRATLASLPHVDRRHLRSNKAIVTL